ncbi:hypothetical protein ABWI01_11375 [Oceanicaulis alexandrii]|uniref:hypothetical protein n=1 Tax=Oceanicaulis alexandrii TaxID=153233 RepID=UPI0035D0708F
MTSTQSDLHSLFSPRLHADERLLWAGKPLPGAKDNRYLIPMVWGAIWTCLVMLMALPAHIPVGLSMLPNPIGLMFVAIPAIMICIGFAITIFSWRRFSSPARMLYAVSDKRLFFMGRENPSNCQTLMIGQLSSLDRKGDGHGDIYFRSGSNSGFPVWMMPFGSHQPDRFLNIETPEHVEKLVLDIMFQKDALS